MAQEITLTTKMMVQAANKEIETISVDDAKSLIGEPGIQFVDIRDVREVSKEGRIPGAKHCPRGLLEFWIDPNSPYHKPMFAEDQRFVFYCRSGWRSALATKIAQDMGLKPVCHIDGGFGAWLEAGNEVEKREG